MQHLKHIRLGAALLACGLALNACTSGAGNGGAGASEAGDTSAGLLPPPVQESVNSGNQAYRSGNYEAALSHFREALEEAPDHPVPLFGVHLAATALGDSALADSIAAILRVEAPWLLEMTEHQEGGAVPVPHAGMGMSTDPHAGMIMTPIPDSLADTLR